MSQHVNCCKGNGQIIPQSAPTTIPLTEETESMSAERERCKWKKRDRVTKGKFLSVNPLASQELWSRFKERDKEVDAIDRDSRIRIERVTGSGIQKQRSLLCCGSGEGRRRRPAVVVRCIVDLRQQRNNGDGAKIDGDNSPYAAVVN
ncbi:hypothetical protein L2E82_01086 [Cichorium intybus]|uniref:Uncharacterized protein n=1 Tax=Cichorium intybus TaxID=13427 RepID=A0ACB9GXT8_CICIN|nr:hypothetical protein L2E82_01086 [Cichorium intybus]